MSASADIAVFVSASATIGDAECSMLVASDIGIDTLPCEALLCVA